MACWRVSAILTLAERSKRGQIREEDLGVGGSFDRHGGDHALQTHGSQDGEDLQW
jgi:hypothetical protein